MRKFINILAFALTTSTGSAMAYNIPYENQVPNYPPEHDVEAYPKAIPCVWQRIHDPSRKDITKVLNCTIIAWPREVSYTDSKGTPHVGPNWQEGYCSNGSCINSVTGEVFAEVPGTILAQTELMYYIQGSGDEIVAHRSGEGPLFGKPAISYAQAGRELRDFYTRGGANARAVDTLFKRRTGLTWTDWQDKHSTAAHSAIYESVLVTDGAAGPFTVTPMESGNAITYQSRAGIMNLLESVVEYADSTGYVVINKAYAFGPDKYILIVSTGESGMSCPATTYVVSFDTKGEHVDGKASIDGCSEEVESFAEGNKLSIKKEGETMFVFNGRVM
ncbi:hypothetical protein FLI62_28320 [Pseudomonas aeruginosa]|uniref:hypothetical protein n=1 Tax=Pseudomonas aeruginosa group TaxID=136841 RepID=UPI001153826E|nr:hypothetical protein [Pseudomonas aeruginosa]TQG98203.1 hypothetical protein FLI62_28320 [Pseudomonas aeruginosa]HEP9620447.1 hypothetical protein [Pseudomonas aeruginosa]